MTDDLVPVPKGRAAGPKKERVPIEWVYLCASELSKLSCGVQDPGPERCRMGCPFLQKRRPGQGPKRVRTFGLKSRLVDYGQERLNIIGQWTTKEREMKEQGKPNDEYIMHHIVEILNDPNPKVVYKLLTSAIRRCKLPLFRDYYRKARTDMLRLKKIQKDHIRARKMAEKEAILDAARRGLQPGEGVDGVLPTEPSSQEGAAGTVERVSD